MSRQPIFPFRASPLPTLCSRPARSRLTKVPSPDGRRSCWAFPVRPKAKSTKALALKPTTVILWLGNNDALVPAITGQLAALTPLSIFTAAYHAVIGTLATTKATLITANIPDVTAIPYFTSATSLAEEAHVPLTTVTSVLGIGGGDYIRTTGVPIALGLLQGQSPPPPYVWPTSCPLPIEGLLPPGVPLPCVFTASNAATVRATIASYNTVIAQQSARFGSTLVDINALLAQLSTKGYKVSGHCLNTHFLEGLFSLDGIHPTDTGYAIIANQFIYTMNASLNLNIRDVNVPEIVEHDPLVLPRVQCPRAAN